MSKPSAPAAPDYVGAAQAQGAANVDAARATAKLSNPNIINPYGTQSVSYDGDIPTVTQSLSPVGQQQFDQNMRINSGLGDTAEQGLGYVQKTLDQPFDMSKVPNAPVNAGTTAQQAILSRLEPQQQRQRTSMETELTNQGLRPGMEGWDNAMKDLGYQENDARQQAALQGVGLDTSAHQQGVQEQEFLRTEPLNILNAVRSASPVNIPQFQQYGGAQTQASPIMQGTQAQNQAALQAYGIQQGGQNAMMSGLAGLGAAGMGAYGLMSAAPILAASDRRLKSNIKRIGTHRLGIGVYSYGIFGRNEVGVMADEVEKVMPAAVVVMPNGYKAVNYSMLNSN